MTNNYIGIGKGIILELVVDLVEGHMLPEYTCILLGVVLL